MKRASLVWSTALVMLLGMCGGTLVAQPPDDSVFVKISSFAGTHPLATVVGVLHSDDCDSVEIVMLILTWHGNFDPVVFQPITDWKARRGEADAQKNFEYPTGNGFPEDAHVSYRVWPDGSLQTLDIDPVVAGHPYRLAPSCPPLPIQLSSFTGTLINNRVRLDWTTISEVNNYGFFVQKKRTGESEWTEIPNSFVAGHGTTNVPQHYTFTDDAVITTPVQYRLNQIDLDGTVHNTEPIQITNPTSVKEIAPREFALQQNYPNPFNPETHIKFSVAASAHTRLEVYNLVGQKVATLFDEIAEPGFYYTVRFDGSNLASGVYIYRIQTGSYFATKRLILLR